MDITREQTQQPEAPPPTPKPTAPLPPLAASSSQPAPSNLEVGARLVRLLLHRLAHQLNRVWRWAQPQAGWLILTSFLLGVIAVLGLSLVLPRLFSAAAANAGDTRTSLIAPAASVESFLQAQQTFDADQMWDAFSAELRTQLEEQSINRDSLAQFMEQERQAGQRYRDFEYVGGVNLPSRQTMYFYAVEIESPDPQRNGTFSFTFTVDSTGKIIGIKS